MSKSYEGIEKEVLIWALRRHRRNLKLSPLVIADETQLSPLDVTNLELGKKTGKEAEVIRKLSTYYGYESTQEMVNAAKVLLLDRETKGWAFRRHREAAGLSANYVADILLFYRMGLGSIEKGIFNINDAIMKKALMLFDCQSPEALFAQAIDNSLLAKKYANIALLEHRCIDLHPQKTAPKFRNNKPAVVPGNTRNRSLRERLQEKKSMGELALDYVRIVTGSGKKDGYDSEDFVAVAKIIKHFFGVKENPTEVELKSEIERVDSLDSVGLSRKVIGVNELYAMALEHVLERMQASGLER